MAAILSAAFSFPVAWVFVRIKKSRLLIFICTVFLLSIPAPITGIGIIKILNSGISEALGRIYDSGLAIVIGYGVRFLPFAVLANIVGVRQIPFEHEEAARLEGATLGETLACVTLPLGLRSFAISGFIVFILSIGEVATTLLTCAPGVTPLSVRFFSLIHYGMRAKTSAICLIIMAAVIFAAAILTMVLWRFFKKKLE